MILRSAILLLVLGSLQADIIAFLESTLGSYGYFVVFFAIMVESMGIPFPGETALIIASAYAARTGDLNIYWVIAASAAGAIVGDNFGYWIGREGGRKLIIKYGKFVGLTDDRYQKAQEYLKKHGGKAVFFGRFVSVARTWIAVLVGAHHLNWTQFFIYNVLGGIVWASIFGTLGYVFGENLPYLEKIIKDVGIAVSVLVVIGLIVLIYLRKRSKKKKEALANTTSKK
jgi:membrane protein DedA with SNARE-associated domain